MHEQNLERHDLEDFKDSNSCLTIDYETKCLKNEKESKIQAILLHSQSHLVYEDLNNQENQPQALLSNNDTNKLLNSQLLNAKTSSILRKINGENLEQDFRDTCKTYEVLNSSDSILKQAYHEYISAYFKITSIYHINWDKGLIAYDTESERENGKVLDLSELLDSSTCIAQLSNNELFCFGKDNNLSENTLIIDRNYEIRMLSSLIE